MNERTPNAGTPQNYGPGLSFYNLMQPTGIIAPDGSPQIAVAGVTQDLSAALGWMMQSGGRSVALMYVLAVNPSPLHPAPSSPIINPRG